MEIRDIWLTPAFYSDLKAELHRPEADHVSLEQFELYELPTVLHVVATSWEQLPERFRGHGRYRVLIQAGVLVAAYAIEAELLRDGRVALVSIKVDPHLASLIDPEEPPSDE